MTILTSRWRAYNIISNNTKLSESRKDFLLNNIVNTPSYDKTENISRIIQCAYGVMNATISRRLSIIEKNPSIAIIADDIMIDDTDDDIDFSETSDEPILAEMSVI